MLSPGVLTLPRRLIPALMLLAADGAPPPAAVVDLERCGVASGGIVSPDAAALVGVMTDPDLVVSIEVTTRDAVNRSTIWATAERAVWGRPVEQDVYQLRSIDTVTVPLLLAQLTGVGRRPETPFSGSVTVAADALAAALDWQTDDPETALAILVSAGAEPVWADRILIANQHRRAQWTVSSVWVEQNGGHEVHEATVLDAGPAGYWRISRDEPGTSTYTVASMHETMRLLRRCLPSRSLTSTTDPG
jgi:hypothetical protein